MNFDEMLDKWNIPSSRLHCVLHDAGAKMKKSLLLSSLNNVDNTVHKIQLIVKSRIPSGKEIGEIICIAQLLLIFIIQQRLNMCLSSGVDCRSLC